MVRAPLGGVNASNGETVKSRFRGALSNVSNSLIDERDTFGTVSGTSCTSGFTSRALEIHQKLRRRKSLSKKVSRSYSETPEIAEEYEIQTVVSGLTRNSEFKDERDPPPSVSDNDNALERYAEWPDDESCGHHETRGHHVIRVMDGDQVTAKNVIHRHEKDRLSRYQKVNTNLRFPEPKGRELESTTKNNASSKSDKTRRKDSSSGKRLESNTKNNASLKSDKTRRKDSSSGFEILIRSEHDRAKSRNSRRKFPIEPSGTKIDALIYSCSQKNENHRNNISESSRRRPPTVLMNDQHVELVYQENNPGLSEQNKRNILRRRSKSTNAGRRRRDNGYPSKNTDESQNKRRSIDVRDHSVNQNIRSRSLPRNLKRISSSNVRDEEVEFEGHPPNDTFPPSFIHSGIQAEILSPLGSQCEGIEQQVWKRQEVGKVQTKYSHKKLYPPSCEAMRSPPSCEINYQNSEPGHFQTTCYSGRRSMYTPNRDKDQQSRRYSKREINTHRDKSKIVFPNHYTKEDPPDQFSNNRNKNRAQIDAIVGKASRNLLLSPNGDEDSYIEDEDHFEKYHRKFVEETNEFEIIESSYHLDPPTPLPERELRQEFSSHKSRVYNESPGMTLLSMTPAGRKDLIQRYLALREKHSKIEASMISRDRQELNSSLQENTSHFSRGHACGSVYDADNGNRIFPEPSFTRNKVKRNNRYDDASIHYEQVDPQKMSSQNSYTNENYGRSIGSRGTKIYQRMGRAPTQTSSGTLSNDKRSTSGHGDIEKTNMSVEARESMISLPNAYKLHATDKESLRSPTLVSSHPYFKQEKLSYSYASDDTSAISPMAPKYMFNPYKNKYEEELAPHNQFMKIQMGFGKGK